MIFHFITIFYFIYEDLAENASIQLTFEDSSYFITSSKLGLEKSEYSYSTEHVLGNLKFNFERDSSKIYENASIPLTLLTKRNAYKYFDQKIVITNFISGFTQGSLMQIAFTDQDARFATQFVDRMNEIFLEKSIIENSEQAKASVSFLQERIEAIEELLRNSEKKLNLFQQENLLFEQAEESTSLLEQLLINNNRMDEFELEEIEVLNQYSAESMVYKNLQQKRRVLEDQKKEILDQISALPEIEQRFINLRRDVEVNQNILEELLNRRLEFSIIEASTIPDIIVIDEAYVDNVVSPRPFFAFIALNGLFLMITLALVLIRIIYFSRYNYPGEIVESDSNLKLLGVLPKEDEIKDNKVQEASRSLASNLILLIRKELKLQDSVPKKVLVTGPLKGVGKTYSSIKIASELFNIGKTVALLDFDFRQGDIHKTFSLEKININDLNEHFDIEKFKLKEKGNNKFYVVPRPTNASDKALSFFDSSLLSEIIERISKKVDFLVIDSAPCLPVSDSLLVAKHVDLIVSVARHKNTKQRDFEQMIDQFNMITDTPNYVVYNDYRKPLGYYGYQYYDYYAYKYYGSDYEYDEKN